GNRSASGYRGARCDRQGCGRGACAGVRSENGKGQPGREQREKKDSRALKPFGLWRLNPLCHISTLSSSLLDQVEAHHGVASERTLCLYLGGFGVSRPRRQVRPAGSSLRCKFRGRLGNAQWNRGTNGHRTSFCVATHTNVCAWSPAAEQV